MGYVISKTGFGNLPRADIQIDSGGYELSNASILSGNYTVMTGAEMGLGSAFHQYKFVVYNGSFTAGETVVCDPLVLFFPNKAKDYSGKKYDVKITYQATVELPNAFEGDYLFFTRATPTKSLQIVSTHAPYPPSNTVTISGTSVEVTVEILDHGTPIDSTAMIAVGDIDAEDLMNIHYGTGTSYGIDGQYVLPYQEQIQPGGTVLSPIYMEADTLIITNPQHTEFGGSALTTSMTEASVAYLVRLPMVNTFCCSSGGINLFTQSSDFSQYTITASSGEGGKISPTGSEDYNYGTNATYHIIPDYGYEIDDVVVDGVSVGDVTSYTFSNIKTDHTIHATFLNVIPPCSRPMGDMNICGESKLYIPEDCEDETS